jgi:glycyl-tRNA synthetase beta chain
LGEKLGFDPGRIKRAEEAARLSKADLTCEMVKELPELQGYMGRVYALLEGEEEEVAIALEEQYYPLPGEENYPTTIAGTILSLVDKMDNIVSSFSLGRVPSGSQDPWGLRRMAQGIVNIILHSQWYLPLSSWVEKNISLLAEQGLVKGDGQIKIEVVEFLFNRLRLRLLGSGFNYSVINAVLNTPVDDLYEAFKKIEVLEKLRRERKLFLSEIVTGFTRANNISKGFSSNGDLREDWLQEDLEIELYKNLQKVEQSFRQAVAGGDYLAAFEVFYSLLPVLNQFFDQVLVMCEEKDLRENRLNLMKKVVNLWKDLADLSQIVIEGE